jgi:HEAT repeat protein
MRARLVTTGTGGIMRKFAAAACLALLTLGCENAFREEATYEGAPTSSWAALATDRGEDVERRRKAVEVLGELGPTEADRTVPALRDALTDPDAEVRLLALRALGKLAPKASKAQAAVGRAINDRNKYVAKEAMRTYRAIEKAKPSALPSS